MVSDSHHLIRSRIRIKIKAESWFRIRIKVMHIRNCGGCTIHFLFAGKIYYYNAATRATQWTKPEGPDVKILTQDEVEKLQKKVGGAGGGDGDNNKQQSRDGGGQEDRGADRMGSVDRDQGSMDREMRGPGKKK